MPPVAFGSDHHTLAGAIVEIIEALPAGEADSGAVVTVDQQARELVRSLEGIARKAAIPAAR